MHLIKNLDPRNPEHRNHEFTPVQIGEFPYHAFRCVCGGLVKYIGSTWEIYHIPGSGRVYRCRCGIEIEA